jgi:hypothetical protein
VQKGLIVVNDADPNSKSVLSKPITIRDFDTNQHIALWMRISSSLNDAHLDPEEVENDGYLNITDVFSFRVVGSECSSRVSIFYLAIR